MKCKHCGSEMPENACVCLACNNWIEDADEELRKNAEQFGLGCCSKCGYAGEPELEKIIRPRDWLIFALLFMSGFGIIYILVIYFMRSNPQKRNLVCPVCKNVMAEAIDNRQVPGKDDLDRMKNTATTLAKDPEFRKTVKQSAKKIRRSMQELSRSLDP